MTKKKDNKGTPPPIKLPFVKRSEDPGEWAYDHRVGLCVTLIAYLLFGIIFMSYKIAIAQKEYIIGMYIDLSDIPEQVEQRPTELHAGYADDFSDVRNVTSNQNADLDEALAGAQTPGQSQAYGEAAEALDRLRANREAYEAGLAAERAMIEAANRRDGNGETKNVKVKGRVTVSFSFTDPIRNSVHLHIPAYQCEGGGEVTVNVLVNNNGDVVSAMVAGSSSADRCLRDMAVAAALRSRFNIDVSAPEKHRGTIEYIFIPQ